MTPWFGALEEFSAEWEFTDFSCLGSSVLDILLRILGVLGENERIMDTLVKNAQRPRYFRNSRYYVREYPELWELAESVQISPSQRSS